MLTANVLLHPGCEWIGFISLSFLSPARHEVTFTFNWSVYIRTFRLTNYLDC